MRSIARGNPRYVDDILLPDCVDADITFSLKNRMSFGSTTESITLAPRGCVTKLVEGERGGKGPNHDITYRCDAEFDELLMLPLMIKESIFVTKILI